MMLNEKSKIKVVYKVWSSLIPWFSCASNLCIWKPARCLHLEDPQTSQIQHVRVWTQYFFFLHSQIHSFLYLVPLTYWYHHPPSYPSQNPEPLPLPGHLCSISGHILPEYLAKIAQLYPLFAGFPPLPSFRVLPTPFQLHCNTPPCHQHCLLSLHTAYFTHLLYGTTCSPHTHSVLFPAPVFLFFSSSTSLYPLPSFFTWLFLLQDSAEMSPPPGRVSWFSHYPQPGPHCQPWPRSLSSPRPQCLLNAPKCIYAKLYCNDLCLTVTAILDFKTLEGR